MTGRAAALFTAACAAAAGAGSVSAFAAGADAVGVALLWTAWIVLLPATLLTQRTLRRPRPLRARRRRGVR